MHSSTQCSSINIIVSSLDIEFLSGFPLFVEIHMMIHNMYVGMWDDRKTNSRAEILKNITMNNT